MLFSAPTLTLQSTQLETTRADIAQLRCVLWRADTIRVGIAQLRCLP